MNGLGKDTDFMKIASDRSSEAAEQMWQASGQMSGVVKERDILNVSEFKLSVEL